MFFRSFTVLPSDCHDYHYYFQIIMADSGEVDNINQDSQFIGMLSDSGCTTTLTVGLKT